MTMLAQFAAAGGGALPAYIEDVFSTFLYTGNGSTQTITNGIDLAGEGGLVWIKDRDSGAKGHALFDTARGVNKKLQTQSTNGEFSSPNQLTAFNATGFDLGSSGDPNGSGTTYASWTFRKQPKFFDVVTYTGTGSTRTVSHNLGSVPGCMIIKQTSAFGESWGVYHRSLGATKRMYLDLTNAESTNSNFWSNTEPTSTEFTVGIEGSVNASGQTYVAYLFAHDAGGFGLSGSENVISCGSFTPDGSGNATVDLGFEPQWLIMKNSTSANDWYMYDTMRGFSLTSATALYANTANSEISASFFNPTATGFKVNAVWNGLPTIYIAIRRGPMKVPELGTKVYTGSLTAASTSINAGFIPDMAIVKTRDNTVGSSSDSYTGARLIGNALSLSMNSSAVEGAFGWQWDSTTNTFMQTSIGAPVINWLFARAPSVMDVVCYTGTGVARTVAHNLAAVPELIIVKSRSNIGGWGTYSSSVGISKALELNLTNGSFSEGGTYWNNTPPTSTVFSVATDTTVNGSGRTYVAYLFATCAGVSKVGSYTGTGTTQAINCGFTTGARFVLIKRTDSTGDWYVWDSARGIVAGNDPYLQINNTAVEVTSTDYVDASATGFELTSTAPAAINASGGSYIFLAVA